MTVRRAIRDNGLSLFFLALFVPALLGQSVPGFLRNNSELVDVAENWQSEFLAVGTMVAFSIYLRQRGSAESKPAGVPHHVSSTESE